MFSKDVRLKWRKEKWYVERTLVCAWGKVKNVSKLRWMGKQTTKGRS